MNPVQLHLILTHFPIVGLIFSVALLLYALISKRQEARAIALIGIAISGLIVLPVLWTGEAAEERVESLPGVSENLMERHEDAADIAGNLAVLAGVVAALALLAGRVRPGSAGIAALAALIAVIPAIASVGWTAHLGGRIRHPELTQSFPVAATESDGMERGQDGLYRGGQEESKPHRERDKDD